MKPAGLHRRHLLKSGLLAGAAAYIPAVPEAASAEVDRKLAAVDSAASFGNRRWLGPDWWANRTQDWQRAGHWIECTRSEGDMEARTAALLTCDLGTKGSARIAWTMKADVAAGRGGFGGLLLGVGSGRLHHLSAALAQRGSGRGGGLFAVIDADGRPAFREHSDEANPLAYAELKAERSGSSSPIDLRAGVQCTLDIVHAGGEMAELRLSVAGREVKLAIPSALLAGGILLVSSPASKSGGARFSFADIALAGPRVSLHPERKIGPCLGALYSIANGVLKMSAHFGLLGEGDSNLAVLQVRQGNGRWRNADTAGIGDGSCALFRVKDWNGRAGEYRILYSLFGKQVPVWQGKLRADPGLSGKGPVIAMEGCVLSTQHALEDNVITRVVPQERNFGRYEPENFNFPHADIVRNSIAHDPDLVFVSGDQYYEHNPTRPERATPDSKLDTLYRWQQWLLSFAELVRDRPCIVLVDDHDVLHGNLWGNGGRDAPRREQNEGGYAWGKDLVQMVYRMQCGHNPDPDDPAPVLNDLPVSYGAFVWGNTSFAIIEDRKWKTSAIQGLDMDVHRAQLLGSRQEAFLAKWKDMHPGLPKIMLTASQWACLQTDPEGQPLLDFDANGYPPLARRRAVELARDTKCLMLSGDQHLPSLIRLGVDSHIDGPLQFTGPAGGTFWQRWFQPQPLLANQRDGNPLTGDFRDAFANPMRVLAVANPRISFAEFRKYNKGRSQAINDRNLKSEGYGIVRVDHGSRSIAIECWKWDAGPQAGTAGQYDGWPYRVGFDEM